LSGVEPRTAAAIDPPPSLPYSFAGEGTQPMIVRAARIFPSDEAGASGNTRPGQDDVSVGQTVLRIGAAALLQLADSMGTAFVQAVDALAATAGRVVVSGIGKSGLVARKIAATLASTGTPALFVHPAEASHGDLGMIVAGDSVLALSNSGETTELADLVAHAKRFGLKLIAITARADSTLAAAADIALLLPAAKEACPMGLAPTTSTTMQMALGDALAVALLTRRGFNEADFRTIHPGGRLGAQLLRVDQLMHTGEALPLGTAAMPMDEALLEMTRKRFGTLGVIDTERHLVGVLTDGDLRRAMGPDLLTRRVGDIMNPSPRSIAPDALVASALREMNDPQRPITTLFVVSRAGKAAGTVAGILHIHDLLRAGIA
jgi:arabinose-5-phosphate isomerase